ncbi:T9SS type A sorting domain-containing protein [Maribacter aurantiacus]|uniref:T9SS type A sorting domain-containing protein n=1 Tax=Maribacter aurantiacus TaxID=1882343 RepID=UPI0013759BA6|nr:T9SS type A sorting domain-containing protein [Maribacter aurantiacus]
MNVEKVPGGVVFLSSNGLEKRNETGQQLWRFDFFGLDEYRYSSKPSLGAIAVDESGNIYARLTFPSNNSNDTSISTVSNIDIPHGNSIIKINSEGKLLWARKITGSKSVRVEYHKGSIYAIGLFSDTLNIDDTYLFDNIENTECGNSYEDLYAEDIFIAKWNTIGQIQHGVRLGEAAYDRLKAVTLDQKGNMFLAVNYGESYCTPNENRIYKISPDLETLWSKTIVKEYEQGNGTGLLNPTDLYVGPNGKLYYWCYVSGKVFTDTIRIANLANYGSAAALVEFNARDGSFLNYRFFEGFSVYSQRGHMAYYKDHLLIATSFRETQEFDNGSITTVNPGEEPVLLKVDLNSFNFDHVMHLSGIPQPYHTSVKDWSGPVVVDGDNLYYSGSFSSDTLNLTPNVNLYNNSGNNDQDYFLTKYSFAGLDFSTTEIDDDGDGVSNAMDLCPSTALGEEVDEQGCSLVQKDSDLDGVTDDLDTCPDTIPGAEVNSEGCSQEQIDTDGDGVPDFRDNCSETEAGVLVNEDGCEIVTLDSNLFQIETVGEACEDANNGSIFIQTQDSSRAYRVILNGSQEISFTGETLIENLKAGQYDLCILADGLDSDMLCYTLTIAAGTEISLVGIVNLGARTLNLELSGGTVYKINFNGKLLQTTQSYLELDLKEGLNQVNVTTDLLCQGNATYKVDLGSALRVAPNPFSDEIDLSYLSNSNVVTVNIYNQTGQQVYQKWFGPWEPIILKDLSHLKTGVYLLEFLGNDTYYSQKIIKR